MSEITREALEDMGFEINASTKEYVMWASDEENYIGVILPAYDYPLSVTQYSGDTVVMELPHIRTLPQLRQLIRSLFGDEALPRRELSSITDEECRKLWGICHEDIAGVKKSTSIDGIIIKGESQEEILIVGDGTIEAAQNSHDWELVPLKAYNYLVNVCDFHLPAFHE